MQIKRLLWAVAALFAAYGFSMPAHATDQTNILQKSNASISTEVSGLNAPDAKFAVAALKATGNVVDQISDSKSPLGDQGGSQIVQRSYGCSSGCSMGCSTGCSTGCSSGCSSGCSYGCR